VRSRSAPTRHLPRLAINGRFLSQPTTGVQRYAREIVWALDRILCQEDAPPRIDIVLLVPPNGHLEHGSLKRITVRPVGARTGHAWEQIDLPLAARTDLLLSLANTAPLAHARQIVTIHDAATRAHPDSYSVAFRAWYWIMHRVLAARATRIMTVSNFSASELERWYRIPRETIAIIPNAAGHIGAATNQPAILRQHGLAAQSYVLSLGTHCRSKNFALVIEAMNRLPQPRPRLVVAGRMDANHFRTPMQWDARAFINVGAVSDGELGALYTNALCFVFPSVYEGFGIPPLEAMSCGCPVIVSRAAALPETCGAAALYCDPHDPSDLAAKIAVLLRNPELRDCLQQAGLARSRRFTWDDSARRVIDLVRSELQLGADDRGASSPMLEAAPAPCLNGARKHHRCATAAEPAPEKSIESRWR
jgi:glycosyltransferase involved in cell wall biosynthesis